MKSEVGLWIDHRKAVIMTIKNEAEMIREVRSNIDKHGKNQDETSKNANNLSQGSTAEDMRDRKFDGHLTSYYNGIISQIHEADSIWIFGPGEAKVELENLLKQEGLGARIVGIETVDKMTDHQIEAKIRLHFLGK